MKAEIFYLKEQQQKLYREIASNLRDLYKDIEIDGRAIDDKYNTDNKKDDDNSESYVRLFKASTITTSDFDIVIKDDRWKGYSYFGTGHEKRKKSNKPYLLLFHSSMPQAFPVVAVMGRLVMVPYNIHKVFEMPGKKFAWLLKPLDKGGTLLVNFQNEEALKVAVQQVGKQLQREVVKFCIHHMLAREIIKPNFAELGDLLGIHKEYISLQDEEIKKAIVQPILHIDSDPVHLEKRSPVVLRLENRSKNAFGRIQVQIMVPATQELLLSKFINLPALGSATLHFEITPMTSPYYPLEIQFVNDLEQDFALLPTPVILDVLEAV